MTQDIFVGGIAEGYAQPETMRLKYTNRHGLIAGATGTGKTVTLQILAQSLSEAGVPVFLSDVKGDLSGLAKAGNADHKLHSAFTKRAEQIGLNLEYRATPVLFWDLFGRQGHRVRTTLTEMGPLLLSRLMDLTDAQEGVLNIAFHLADEEGMALLDLKDLQALLVFLGEQRAELGLRYGNISTASIGAIQRKLLVLEGQGAGDFFAEPALEIEDLMRCTSQGAGYVSILAADELMKSPKLYATFLLWLLSELFETLPEVGDMDKPKMVFFFDEAHLLFDDAPKALVDQVEQVARLIRSKGVGVFFVTQNPEDIPEDILGQLGNRVQHALRAFTAKDQKALRRAAQNYRSNPDLDIETAIKEVGVGEAVTSFLDEKGTPSMAQRCLIRPPSSQLGPITKQERESLMTISPVAGKYDTTLDRHSAFEILQQRSAIAAKKAAQAEKEEQEFENARRYKASARSTQRRGRSGDSLGTAFAKSMARSLGSRAGRTIVRGILGSLFKGR